MNDITESLLFDLAKNIIRYRQDFKGGGPDPYEFSLSGSRTQVSSYLFQAL